MSPTTPPNEGPSWFVIRLTATASLGGCLFGYDMGAISGALPLLQSEFDLDETQQEWLVSILYLGGGLGASVGGSICDRAGRKRAIILTDVIFMLGAAWLCVAQSYTQVLMGRFVVGIGVAISGVADVSYLHECAPQEWRGAVVSVNEACISLGFLLAYIAGYVYSKSDEGGWRKIFGWAGVVALIQLMGMCSLPESPAWLARKGRLEEARRAWQKISGGEHSSGISEGAKYDTLFPVSGSQNGHPTHMASSPVRLNDITPGEVLSTGLFRSQDEILVEADGEETYQHPHSDSFDGDSIPSLLSINRHPLSRASAGVVAARQNFQSILLTMSRYRRQVYISLFLAVTQQFCGQTNVLNYAPLIFAEAAKKDHENGFGNDDDDGSAPDWSTITIGLVKFIVTVLVIWRIEYVGRRILLLAGTTLIVIGLFALIVAFGGSSTGISDEGQTNGTSNWSPITNLKTFHLALPGVLLVVCGYSMSFGPLTWLLTSEIFPTDIRGRALGASTIVTYLCASIVTRTFLSARSVLGPSKLFGTYCIITMFGVLFEYLAIPDTGEKTVEEIEHSLSEMYWWRFDAVTLSQLDQDDMVPS